MMGHVNATGAHEGLPLQKETIFKFQVIEVTQSIPNRKQFLIEREDDSLCI